MGSVSEETDRAVGGTECVEEQAFLQEVLEI